MHTVPGSRWKKRAEWLVSKNITLFIEWMRHSLFTTVLQKTSKLLYLEFALKIIPLSESALEMPYRFHRILQNVIMTCSYDTTAISTLLHVVMLLLLGEEAETFVGLSNRSHWYWRVGLGSWLWPCKIGKIHQTHAISSYVTDCKFYYLFIVCALAQPLPKNKSDRSSPCVPLLRKLIRLITIYGENIISHNHLSFACGMSLATIKLWPLWWNDRI